MGGRAFRNMGYAVRPIMLDEYLRLLPVLGTELRTMGALKIVPIGSTGKVQVMGDIDLAVEHPKGRDGLWMTYSMQNVTASIKQVGRDVKSSSPKRFGSRQLTVCYPFEAEGCSRQGLDRVQLDLVVGPVGCIPWLEWAYHSPGDTSQCRGVIRNLLLNTITREMGNVKGQKRTRHLIDWNAGLYEATQERDRVPVVKTKNVPVAWRTVNKTFVTDGPDKVVNIIFGPKYGAKDVLTFDDAVGALKKTSPRAREILDTFVSEMKKLSYTKQHHFGNTVLVCNTVLDYIDRACS